MLLFLIYLAAEINTAVLCMAAIEINYTILLMVITKQQQLNCYYIGRLGKLTGR